MRSCSLGVCWTLLQLLFSISASPVNDPNGLTIQTSSGRVHGKIDSTSSTVRQFLGIPFAQPPLGDLRFLPPQPLLKTASNRDIQATELPPSCLQYLGTGASVYTRNVLEFNLQGLNRTGSISEDCLTLSVWTPTLSTSDSEPGVDPSGKKLLPVLVFVYGGGYSTGGQDVPYQIPTQWVQRTRDHIVVSFNYRVNFFGYPNAAGLKPEEQNAGLLDQRAAVQWVYDNVAAFGGDTKRIVLWGQSAGASSVDLYTLAYPSNPIVSGFIMDSGTGLLSAPKDANNHSTFSYVASQIGCGGLASDPAGELACVRRVDGKKIESFIADHSNAGASPSLGFSPVGNNITAFSNYNDRVTSGKVSHLPAIIGTNSEDGVPFVGYNPAGPSYAAQLKAGLSTFFCPATETARLRLAEGIPVYRYYYGGNFSNVSPAPWMGAYHSSELAVIFGTSGNYRSPSSPFEQATGAAFQNAYVAFANGNVESTGWQKYANIGDGTVRNFGNATTGQPAQSIDVRWLENMCNGAMVA